jgi:hypothetical protein
MRNFIDILTEATQPKEDESIGEAAWWVQRWITGSLNDPDWETDWLQHVHNHETAFQIIHNRVGNKYSQNRVLWRALDMSKKAAKQLKETKILYPHKLQYQSFTVSRDIAIQHGEEWIGFSKNLAVVSCIPPVENIMFGMEDLKKSRDNDIKEIIMYTSDWAWQKEVIVRVDTPIELLSVEIISN